MENNGALEAPSTPTEGEDKVVISWFESMTAGEQGQFVLAALPLIGSAFWAVFTWLRPNPRSTPETTNPQMETPNTSQSETTFNIAP